MSELLCVEGLNVTFDVSGDTLHAVRGIDLTLGEGEVLALVGESGSGKSVTSKAILGILPGAATVRGGTIAYRGRNLLELPEKEMCDIRGKRIAMVPQDPFTSLDPIVKVGYQITEVIEGRRGVTRRDRYNRAVELMREVGISEPEKRFFEYPFRFSGGMRQRIAIAAALSGDPEILICDEPTTALDVTIEAQILELLMSLKHSRGLSMLFITHDLGVVARIADRVAVMYAGKIVECGRVDEIFYEPCHPYTWALLSSVPDGSGNRLEAIRGSVPDMRHPPSGDAFADRSDYAMRIDYVLEPPVFNISPTHTVSSWLYHEDAPVSSMPAGLRERIKGMRGDG